MKVKLTAVKWVSLVLVAFVMMALPVVANSARHTVYTGDFASISFDTTPISVSDIDWRHEYEISVGTTAFIEIIYDDIELSMLFWSGIYGAEYDEGWGYRSDWSTFVGDWNMQSATQGSFVFNTPGVFAIDGNKDGTVFVHVIDTTAQAPSQPTTLANNDISVVINGQTVSFDTAPIVIDGRTMVPMRAIFETLGAAVEWDGVTRTAIATRDNTVVQAVIDSNIINVNGNNIIMDIAPVIIDGRTLVPLRFVSEAFGYDVSWDSTTRTATIISG